MANNFEEFLENTGRQSSHQKLYKLVDVVNHLLVSTLHPDAGKSKALPT